MLSQATQAFVSNRRSQRPRCCKSQVGRSDDCSPRTWHVFDLPLVGFRYHICGIIIHARRGTSDCLSDFNPAFVNRDDRLLGSCVAEIHIDAVARGTRVESGIRRYHLTANLPMRNDFCCPHHECGGSPIGDTRRIFNF